MLCFHLSLGVQLSHAAGASCLISEMICRQIVVEDVATAEGGRRRMVFTSNSNLIQSEAVLHAGSSPAVPAKGLSAGKKKGNKGPKEIERREAATELEVDHSCLAMDYHNAIIASLSMLGMMLLC